MSRTHETSRPGWSDVPPNRTGSCGPGSWEPTSCAWRHHAGSPAPWLLLWRGSCPEPACSWQSCLRYDPWRRSSTAWGYELQWRDLHWCERQHRELWCCELHWCALQCRALERIHVQTGRVAGHRVSNPPRSLGVTVLSARSWIASPCVPCARSVGDSAGSV